MGRSCGSGWVSGPADLVKAAQTIHAYTSFSTPSPLQEGVCEALEAELALGESRDFEGLGARMEANWKKLAEVLTRTGYTVCPAEGGYFLVCDISSSGLTDMEYCKWLSSEHKVAAVPMGVFFASEQRPASLVRFAVCKEAATLDAAVAHLEGATLDAARAAKAALGL